MARRLLFSLLVASTVASCVLPTGTPNVKTSPKGGAAKSPAVVPSTGTPIVPVNGGTLISDKGLGIISDNGGSLIGKVKIPTGLVSNNSGSLISDNGGGIISNNAGGLISDKGLGFRVLAVEEKPLVGFKVTIVDAEGRAIPDKNGKPYQTTTNARGEYSFDKTPRGLNLLVKVDMPPAVGPMFAYLPDAESGAKREAGIDAVSTVVVGYILDRYVKGNLDTLQKLPGEAESDTRAKAFTAFGGEMAIPNFQPQEVVKVVDALRAKDQSFDAQVKYVESLLVAGLKDAGDGLKATEVALSYPSSLGRLSDGSLLVGERNGYRIRRVWPDGKITTFAGKDGALALGDGGPAGDAWIDRPTGLTVDAQDNVYIADFGHHSIRKVDAKTGVITTAASAGSPLAFERPESVVLDAQNRLVFHTSKGLVRLEADGKLTILGTNAAILAVGPGSKVYAWDHNGGSLYTLEGDTLQPVPNWAPAAQPDSRYGLSIASDGTIFVAYGDKLYRHKDGTREQVTLPDTIASINEVMVAGNDLYLIDSDAGRVWKLPVAGGTPVVVAGVPVIRADGVKPEALALNRPSALVFDPSGNLYVADGAASVVWQRRSDGLYYRFAGSSDATGTEDLGDGKPAREARIGKVVSMAARANGHILLTDLTSPATLRVREIDAQGVMHTIKMPPGIIAPAMIAAEADGSLLISDYLLKSVFRVKGETHEEIIPAGKLGLPAALVPQADGSFYVCDAEGGAVYHVIGKTLTPVAGGAEGFSGDGGPATAAKLQNPLGLILDGAGNMYIADSKNDRIRRVNKATGVIETLAGAGGKTLTGTAVDDSLKEPLGMAFDKEGNLYVTDSAHNQIKVIKADLLK